MIVCARCARRYIERRRGFIGAFSLGLWSLDIEALIACARLERQQPVLEHLFRAPNDP